MCVCVCLTTTAPHLPEHLYPTLIIAGVQLDSGFAASALQGWTALTALDVSRCKVGAAGIAMLATSLVALQSLNLSENSSLSSFSELRPLQQLSSLTRLDVSSPGAASMRRPGNNLTAVCLLTQLQYLALNNVLARSRCVPVCVCVCH